MRDLFETIPRDDPVTAARRGARPGLRRRFYANAAVQQADGGYRITLDDNCADNDLARYDSGRAQELDYVLVRPNGSAVKVEWTNLKPAPTSGSPKV